MSDTRQRIIEASLELFNQDGVVRVTTNHIAAHLGMSPGNLYYHFRNREEIVREILPRVIAAAQGTISLPPPGVRLTARDLARYHLSGVEVLWQFRFFFRDLGDIASRDADAAQSLGRLQSSLVDRFVALFVRLAAQGDMRPPGPPAEVRRLADNAVIVWTSWIDFLAATGRTTLERADVVEGALHGLLTFSAYLDDGFARQVRTSAQLWGRRPERRVRTPGGRPHAGTTLAEPGAPHGARAARGGSAARPSERTEPAASAAHKPPARRRTAPARPAR